MASWPSETSYPFGSRPRSSAQRTRNPAAVRVESISLTSTPKAHEARGGAPRHALREPCRLEGFLEATASWRPRQAREWSTLVPIPLMRKGTGWRQSCGPPFPL